jgi:hypothetical protein
MDCLKKAIKNKTVLIENTSIPKKQYMCLVVKGGCSPEIATKDMKSYKVVVPVDNATWMSKYQRTTHEYGKVLSIGQPLKMEKHRASELSSIHPTEFAYHIYEGFHSFAHEEYARQILNPEYDAIVECTIPAGAEYCYGTFGEIVSNKIIVHKNDKNFIY